MTAFILAGLSINVYFIGKYEVMRIMRNFEIIRWREIETSLGRGNIVNIIGFTFYIIRLILVVNQ